MTIALQQEFRKQIRLMGSAFEFVLVADDQETSEGLFELAIAEVKRIEFLLTEFSDTSQTALINAHAGIKPVTVDAEVYNLIKRSKEISALTQGAFDITSGVLKKLYNFKGESFSLPTPEQVQDACKRVGYQYIQLLSNNQVYLEKPGMRIGFGAIGKGYAADCVKAKLQERGVVSGIINASGDLTAWGPWADGRPWKVGIANPDKRNDTLASIPIHNGSVATSGDYEQFFEVNGIRYSHTLDPKTGKPVRGIKSVTIFSPSAELSDALATAVTIMGVTAGLYFIEQLPGVQAIIINEHNKIFTTRHLTLNLVTP